MTIDVILAETRSLPAEVRIRQLETELRHYYYKAHRLEYPDRVALRAGRVVVVENATGLGRHRA
jgi:hypothetical protein